MAEDASPTTAFAASRARFDEVISWAAGQGAADLAHRELEAHLFADARETFRQVLQDILDLRAEREARLEGVLDAAGVAHGAAEDGHDRALESVFGTVVVTRAAYRHRGEKNLCPADSVLNLPVELQSHGLRCMAAIEPTRGSFEGAVEAIERSTGVLVGKRQVEELTQKTAVDFEAFYEARRCSSAGPATFWCSPPMARGS